MKTLSIDIVHILVILITYGLILSQNTIFQSSIEKVILFLVVVILLSGSYNYTVDDSIEYALNLKIKDPKKDTTLVFQRDGKTGEVQVGLGNKKLLGYEF